MPIASRAKRGSGVSELTRRVLWARAAGRCQYSGCNKSLIGDLVSGTEDGNFGFVAVGLLIFATLARDIERGASSSNRFTGHDPVALLYGAAALFLGPGSMVMHGTHTRFGAWIDNLSMVAYILIPWLFNLARLGRWREREP